MTLGREGLPVCNLGWMFSGNISKEKMFFIGVNGRYYTQPGIICYTSAGGYTNREVENESTVGDCRQKAKKTTWFGCLKRNTVYHCIAEVIITQAEVLYAALEIALKLLGKDPEGGTAGGAKHLTCRVVLICGCKDKATCIFFQSRVDKHNGIW